MELALGVWNLGLSAPPHYSLNAEAPALSSLPSCSDQASRGRLHPTSIPGKGLGQAPGGLELVCAMRQQRVHLRPTRGWGGGGGAAAGPCMSPEDTYHVFLPIKCPALG